MKYFDDSYHIIKKKAKFWVKKGCLQTVIDTFLSFSPLYRDFLHCFYKKILFLSDFAEICCFQLQLNLRRKTINRTFKIPSFVWIFLNLSTFLSLKISNMNLNLFFSFRAFSIKNNFTQRQRQNKIRRKMFNIVFLTPKQQKYDLRQP